MCEIMNYILGSLNSSETAIKSIRKTLSRQTKHNRNLNMFALIMTVNLILVELDHAEQKKRIEKLEKTIEKMKRDKGE